MILYQLIEDTYLYFLLPLEAAKEIIDWNVVLFLLEVLVIVLCNAVVKHCECEDIR